MSEWFRRLPGFRRAPAGIERAILRRLPKVWIYGTLLLMLPSLLVRLGGQAAADPGGASAAMIVDIWGVALIFLHWNTVLTLAIGAFIVMVMKGPAYVADAYPLVEAEVPTTGGPR
jgi:energy-converting hydrogenase Eha subunit E